MEYIQASTDVSGGSSGSPLLTESGQAVGILAGGYYVQSVDWYLPLERPREALRDLINGRVTVRGTIQSNWLRETQPGCLARCLDRQTFEKYCPDGKALLRASKVLPESSCAGKVQEDDLLLQANGRNSTLGQFEKMIDKGTGSSITLPVRRHGQDQEVMLDVKNLFTLVPYRILEFAGSKFQDLQYEVAMMHDLPLRGVVLSSARGSFDFSGGHNIMITHLNNRSTPNLDTFIEVARTIPGKQAMRIWNYPCAYIPR